MKFEHIALNRREPDKVSQWYVDNLRMQIVKAPTGPGQAYFVADYAKQMMFELYSSPEAAGLDYFNIDPRTFHLAFAVENVAAMRAQLLQAGATAEGEIARNANGDEFAMLRDPWGMPLQLTRRNRPLI